MRLKSSSVGGTTLLLELIAFAGYRRCATVILQTALTALFSPTGAAENECVVSTLFSSHLPYRWPKGVFLLRNYAAGS